ncbi:PTS sugar transporter subunit IIA [Mariniplasma anaerobium]|uniref:PTS fructose transporter subunit IIA n=1 Tax=Mariniplasma anaerobium TaxID=2735436 RepID=A0A7U9TKI9_9MOLU|nr:fructose PTS transporter subunit IIA [Mariniplasma anaerobium]BCR35379.1 PTS fructose transporter subunit IIA [Mariniplasma anaerobium]
MDILNMIKDSYMNLDLKAKSKTAVIEELAKKLDDAGIVTNLDLLVNDIRIRESLSSTGIGFKIAIPHAKSKYITEPAIVFGKSIDGIDYDSMDGEYAHLFFLICMPENGGNLHLKALAKLSRNLIHESFRLSLEEAKTTKEVLEVLKDIDKEDQYA